MDFLVLGPRWTNSHMAALTATEHLSEEYGALRLRFENDNTDVLQEVAYRKTFGIVAVGNNTAGLVYGVVTAFWSQQHEGIGVYVIGEARRRVEHQLLVHPATKNLKEVRLLLSHPHAFPQCEKTLKRLRLDRVRIKNVGSTAEAARMVAEDPAMRRAAAIATREAGTAYGLYTLHHNVEDDPKNATRFHILGPNPVEPTGHDRTALVLKTPGRPKDSSAVRQVIEGRHNFRPIVRRISKRDAPESVFYCQFNGHRKTKLGSTILGKLRDLGKIVVVLGSYPRSVD